VIPPVNGAPQNVLFQWTPRHTASPTAYNTDYIISIIEMPDTFLTPETAFSSYEPNYVDSTSLTTYLLDNSKSFTFQVGYRYAWRVQAKAKNGTQELAMFRNNGYSETFWFTYKNNCPVPSGIAADPKGQRVNVTWQSDVQHLDYKVEYRQKGNPDAEWFELDNTLPRVSITDLKETTTYEYRVGAACETGVYTFSGLNEFITLGANATTVPSCGFVPDTTITTEPLLQQMNPGDTIKAGDFDVIATQVSGAGSFSGQGYVVVPWLANMKLGVRFTNIGIATNKKLKLGEIATNYDTTAAGIADVDEVISNIKGLADIINDLISIGVDGDKDYIAQLTKQVREIAAQELPETLKAGIVAATQTIDSAKNAYDNLQQRYNDLPDGPGKDAVKDSMAMAKTSFNNAQEQLSDLNKKRESLITDVVQIVLNAVEELQKDYKYVSTSKLSAISDSLRTEIYTDQLLDSVPETTWEYLELESFTDEMSSYDEDYAGFNSRVKNYLSEKTNLTKEKLFQLLFEVFGSFSSIEEKAKEDELFNGKVLIRTLMDKLDKGDSKESLIKYSKQFLTNAISESAELLND